MVVIKTLSRLSTMKKVVICNRTVVARLYGTVAPQWVRPGNKAVSTVVVIKTLSKLSTMLPSVTEQWQ